MVALRRSLFSILAVFAMLCGLSWTAAAYACPEPVVARPADDGCAHSRPVSNVMPYCGPVCLGVASPMPATGLAEAMHPPPYIVTIPTLHGHAYAPDPPPPRGA